MSGFSCKSSLRDLTRAEYLEMRRKLLERIAAETGMSDEELTRYRKAMPPYESVIERRHRTS